MNQPITIQCHIHGEVQFSGATDLGRVSTLYCPLCENETPDTVFRTCDECMPNDPDADDTPSGELEDSVDATAERFPDGDDPLMHHLIEARCRRCDVEFEVQAGEAAWCPSCHEE